ncbi:MAG: methyltransferase domain-containing protein [Proteobacteria bacterium]|nr:methyltransferase domain-containing protein [Pseudomonadota bacterium]
MIDASIDTAISAEMIYYLQHPERFTAEAFRVLRPGGTLLLCTTSPTAAAWDRLRSILRRLGFRRMFFQDGSPRFLGLSRLKLLLDQAGFVVEKTRRLVLLPFAVCDRINRLLERTPLRHLAIFTVIVARKPAAVDARETACIPNRSSGVVQASEDVRGPMNKPTVLLETPLLVTADERT